MALSLADPLDGGAGFLEVTGPSYARAAITNDSVSFPASSPAGPPSVKTTGIAIDFPKATGVWGLCTHWAIFTGATGIGGSVCFGPLNPPRDIADTDILRIPIGGLIITLD